VGGRILMKYSDMTMYSDDSYIYGDNENGYIVHIPGAGTVVDAETKKFTFETFEKAEKELVRLGFGPKIATETLTRIPKNL
jgi:hypothetical protein